MKGNREYVKIIVDTLQLTAVQNIAQRGHCESNDDADENRGNFLEILNFLKNYCKILQANIPNNAKYTHHSMQNAVLEILSEIILEEITEEIREVEYFTISVDETKDIKNRVACICH